MKVRTELIAWYLKNSGLSEKEFCEKCQITKQTLQKIMTSDYKYQTSAIVRIAEAMEIEVCDLYTKE